MPMTRIILVAPPRPQQSRSVFLLWAVNAAGELLAALILTVGAIAAYGHLSPL